MPPGTPHHVVIHVASSLSKKYSCETSDSPASMALTSSLPAPNVAPWLTNPIMAIAKPPPAANLMG